MASSDSVKYFLLGANDAFDECERRVPALEVAMTWLSRSAWPVYEFTKNREAFEPGARVVFYIGGHKRLAQTLIGTATIKTVRLATSAERAKTPAFEKTPVKVLEFDPVALFTTPVSIRPLIERLEIFATVRARWGVALVGGSRRLPRHDFDLIIATAADAAIKGSDPNGCLHEAVDQ